VIDAVQNLMERETAGDPISGLKWTGKTTAKIAWQLKRLGIAVSRNTVGRLLRQMKYSLHTNRKTISAGSTSDRDRQFRYLCRQRDQFEKRGDPVLSVDAKKRELIGNFKNSGARWERTSTAVNDHDFRSAAKGIAIPYGIYDTQANRGSVFLGTSPQRQNSANSPFDRNVFSQNRTTPSRQGRAAQAGSIFAVDVGQRARPRQMAEPGRDLLLYRATQGSLPERFPQPGSPGGATARFSILLGVSGPTVRMEIHPPRPHQVAHETGESANSRVTLREYETVFMKRWTNLSEPQV
jgi:Rhodopirellula transposase DDE domain